jgi:hypothetical protein
VRKRRLGYNRLVTRDMRLCGKEKHVYLSTSQMPGLLGDLKIIWAKFNLGLLA